MLKSSSVTGGAMPVVAYEVNLGAATVVIYDNDIVRVNGKYIPLTPAELTFLRLLAICKGQVCTTSMLLSAMYPDEKKAHQKIFDVLACFVRNKLRAGHPDAGSLIRTVWGRGFSLGLPDRSAVASPSILPQPGARWVTSRKMMILDAVAAQVVTLDEILSYYPDLSRAEFAEWQDRLERHGIPGLRTTRTQVYLACAA